MSWGGYSAEVKDHVLGEKGLYREVCPEGVQNKCPGGVRCRGFMSWGYTLILVISRGVQLYYGIAHLLKREITRFSTDALNGVIFGG